MNRKIISIGIIAFFLLLGILSSSNAKTLNNLNYPPSITENPTVKLKNTPYGMKYFYQVSAVDPDGDSLIYCWDFDGDSVVDKTTIFDRFEKSELYQKARVKVKDAHGLESEWSSTVQYLSKSKYTQSFDNIIDQFFYRFVFMQPLLGLEKTFSDTYNKKLCYKVYIFFK
jgi:hypothetical protein